LDFTFFTTGTKKLRRTELYKHDIKVDAAKTGFIGGTVNE